MSNTTKQTDLVQYEAVNLPVVRNQKELSDALQRMNVDGRFNSLVPSSMNFGTSPMIKVALELVQIDNRVDPATKSGADLYSNDGGKTYTMHLRAANRVAEAANIVWTSIETVGRELEEKTGRVVFVEKRIGWKLKRPNGTVREGFATGSYKWAEDKNRFSAKPMQIESRRHFAEQLAESNAKLRAIYDALGQLPRSMSLEDYRKPFLVPCVIEDYMELVKDDPDMKRFFVAAKMGATDLLFGPRAGGSATMQPQQSQALGAIPVQTTATEGREAVIEEVREIRAETVGMTREEFDERFEEMSLADREKALADLLEKKGIDWPDPTQPFAKLARDRQGDALWYFYGLPDKKQPQPEKKALPWEGRS